MDESSQSLRRIAARFSVFRPWGVFRNSLEKLRSVVGLLIILALVSVHIYVAVLLLQY